MPDGVSDNLSLALLATGTASGTWGTILNSSVYDIIDSVLGDSITVPVSSSNVTLTTTQRQNLGFKLTGVLTNSVSVSLPLNGNSTTIAVGGEFIFDNQSTGAFTVTVKTVAAGSTGVAVPQNARSVVYSDGTNVTFADDAQNQLIAFNGNPNGSVAGNAASAGSRASQVVDRSTNEQYLCTTSGTASSSVWIKTPTITFPSQGYLTGSNSTLSPVLATDGGGTTIYLAAFRGNQVWVYNGTSFYPLTITGGQMAISLNAGFQSASTLYDVMFFADPADGKTPRVGISPAWTTSTVGAGARGSGAGTPQLTRVNGILVNAVSQTLNNGATSYVVAANRATYLGSMWTDSTGASVSFNLSFGQKRKWGLWNYYNRQPILLQAGDSTASWPYNTATIRASNGNSDNYASVFTGMAEETAQAVFYQTVEITVSPGTVRGGIGLNSTSAYTGLNAIAKQQDDPFTVVLESALTLSPTLGINFLQCLEQGTGGGNNDWDGTSANMVLKVAYNG